MSLADCEYTGLKSDLDVIELKFYKFCSDSYNYKKHGKFNDYMESIREKLSKEIIENARNRSSK